MKLLCYVKVTTLLITSAYCLLGGGIAQAELVGWWKLNDGAGMTAHDSSGKRHHGILHGDPQWVRGVVGGALQFDGKDDYVYVGSVGISWTNSRTVTAWVKADSLDIPGGTSVYGFGGEGSFTTLYWDMEVTDGGYYAGYLGGNFSSNWIPLDTEWHHFASTYEAPIYCGYVDGQFLYSMHIGSSIRTVDEFRIGGRLTNNHFFPGIVDDVQVYDEALTLAEIQNIVGGPEAHDPNPEDNAQLPGTDVELWWSPGNSAVSHDIYLSDDFDDVNEGASDAFLGNQTDAFLVLGLPGTPYPDGLALGETYYWRVDEVEVDGETKHTGDVWSFTAEPFAHPIEGIVATSNVAADEGTGPEKAVDGSGLNADDQHSTQGYDMWSVTPATDETVQLQFEFDRVYKLHEMLVWNHNAAFEMVLGLGLKDVTIESSVDGVEWTLVGDTVFGQGTSSPDYTANTTVDFAGAAVKYVRLTVNSGYGTQGRYGLSEVRFLYIPVRAREPQPVDGQTDVDVDTVLGWRAGREAAVHKVYLSTDCEAVSTGAVLVDTVSGSSLAPDVLELGATYYWKIEEVNEAEAISVWEGDLWNFTTKQFMTIEDFESYDNEENLIFETWIDGWGNLTGSVVGYLTAPFAETSIVHGGGQSMPLKYINTVDPYYSEAQHDLSGVDWTIGGANTLRLYVQGRGDNGTDTLYVALEDSAGHMATVTHLDDAVLTTAEWQEWTIPFDNFGGVNLAAVEKIYIGVGDRDNPQPGGEGRIYIDDIRLTKRMP